MRRNHGAVGDMIYYLKFCVMFHVVFLLIFGFLAFFSDDIEPFKSKGDFILGALLFPLVLEIPVGIILVVIKLLF